MENRDKIVLVAWFMATVAAIIAITMLFPNIFYK